MAAEQMGEDGGVPSGKEQRELISEIDEREKMEKGKKMFLIHSKWFRQWDTYVDSYADDGSMALPLSPASPSKRLVQPGAIDNRPLLDAEDTTTLKPNLVEGHDYKIIFQPAWEKLHAWYGGGPEIVRQVVLQGPNCTPVAEVYPLNLVIIKSSDPENQDHKCSISSTATVSELKAVACKELDVKEADVRVWDFYHARKMNLLRDGDTLSESNILSSQMIMLEEKVNGCWEDASGASGASPSPASKGTSPATGYLSSPGLGGPRFFGSGMSGHLQDDVTISAHKDKRGRSGLQNLGNTCFMNSALQCLAHTPQLMEYFLGGHHVSEINRTNPLGMGGELAEAYAGLMEKLWAPGATVVVPRHFKHKVGRFAPQFVGYNQQDSQELLAFLLDGLHEDLNRVQNKPYIEVKDDDNRPDDEVADEAWCNHKARNDSVIVDKFQGQYKSTLVCPECGKKSITFDPFMYLTLQMPSASTRTLTVTVVTSDGSTLPTVYAATVPKMGQVSDLLEALRRMCGTREDEEMLLAELYGSRIYKWFDDTGVKLAEVKADDELVAYLLPGGREQREREAVVVMRGAEEGRGLMSSYRGKKLFAAPLVIPIPPGRSKDRAFLLAAVEAALRPFKVEGAAGGGAGNGATPPSSPGPAPASPGPSPGGGGAEAPASPGRSDVGEEPKSPSGTPSKGLVKMSADGGRKVFELVRTDQRADRTEHLDPGERAKSTGGILGGGISCLGFNRGSAASDDGPEYLALDWAGGTSGQQGEYCLDALLTPAKHASAVAAEAAEQGGKSVTISQCLETFEAEEKLDPEDMWFCPRCKEHRQASKKMDLWKVPEVLVVHLKRFSYSKYWRDKLDTPVDFPLEGLDLAPYMQHRPPAGHSMLYDLHGVSNHFGGLGGGHYTAYAKLEDDKWYNFDDSSCSQVDEESVQKAGSSAYLLFYVRHDAAVDMAAVVRGGVAAEPAADENMAEGMDMDE